VLAAFVGLWLVAPSARAEDVTVAVARLPLPAGKQLDWDDLSTIKLPEELVPPTAVTKGADLVGQTLAHPVAVQAPIVAQRLVGAEVPAQAVAPAGPPEVEIEQELGVVAAMLQAGDTVGWVRTETRPRCVIAWGEVVRRGSPATVRVPEATVGDLQLARDPVVLVPGPGATRPPLPPCHAPASSPAGEPGDLPEDDDDAPRPDDVGDVGAPMEAR